jgi:hypothetical protein
VKEKIGNSFYFTFDYKDEMAAKFITYMLSLEESEAPEWLTITTHSIKKFIPYIKFGCIFGSSIKTKNFNDIDILLVYEQDNADKVRQVKEEIRKSQLTDKPIRYMDITEEDIAKNKDNPVFYSALSDNIVFCNPEKYVEAIKNAAAR